MNRPLSRGVRRALARAVGGLVAVFILAGPGGADVRADAVFYDLTPFETSAPALTAAAACWAAPAASTSETRARVADLDAWLSAHGAADPVSTRTATWLRARLLSRLGDATGATVALGELVATPGAFGDDARLELATLADEAGNPLRAASLRLQRHPGSPRFQAEAERALAALGRAARHPKRGAKDLIGPELERLLARTLPRDSELAFTIALADLWKKQRRVTDARALLRDAWWNARSSGDRAKLASALHRHHAPITRDEELAREVLTASRAEVAGEQKQLRRWRPRGRLGRSVKQWAELVLARFDDDRLESTLTKLERLRRRFKKTSFEPYWHFGMAEVLRRLDKDDDAVEHYLIVAHQHPDGAGAATALERASRLLRYLGKTEEARRVDRELVARDRHGGPHRAALWRLGFDAVLAGDAGLAEQRLGELSARYGGEPDRHAIAWAERADYWRARAAEAAGDASRARALYERVRFRYPAGWYALLARSRGAGSEDPPVSELAVVRVPELDTAVALYRLGDADAAIAALDALMRADALPGSGRALYAQILADRGDTTRAGGVLRHDYIPAVRPGHPLGGLLKPAYPIDFVDELKQAAEGEGIPPALLAAIASVETRFQARGKSSVGAIGLCQLMPATGTALGRDLYGDNFAPSRLWEPETNLRIAAHLLARLRDRWGGHPALMAAAFNAGNGNVARWLAERGDLDTDAFVELIPYRQAKRYVARVLTTAEIYRVLYDLPGEPLLVPRAIRPATPLKAAPDEANEPASPPEADP